MANILHRLIWVKFVSMLSMYVQSATQNGLHGKYITQTQLGETCEHAFCVCAISDTQAFSLKNDCGFDTKSYCSDNCGYHRRPQTLAELCRNMVICCGFTAVAARGKYSLFMSLRPTILCGNNIHLSFPYPQCWLSCKLLRPLVICVGVTLYCYYRLVMLQAVSVILAHNVIGVAIRSDLKRITLLAWIFPWDMDISHFA